jgi:hypothetical protein
MTDLMEIECEDWRWMKLAQDRIQWWALTLAVLSLWGSVTRVS